MSESRRKDRRIRSRNAATVRFSAEYGELAFGPGISAETVDLSLSGARIRSADPFAVGDSVRLHVEFRSTGHAISVDGVVRWVRRDAESGGFDSGVEFRDLHPRTILALMQNLYQGPSTMKVVLT